MEGNIQTFHAKKEDICGDFSSFIKQKKGAGKAGAIKVLVLIFYREVRNLYKRNYFFSRR